MTEDKFDNLREIMEEMRREVKDKLAKLHPELYPDVRKSRLKAIRAIHHEAVHAIRKFAVEGHFGVIIGDGKLQKPYEPYDSLANAFRNAVAGVLECNPTAIHCTLKYCTGKEGTLPQEWEVWTFARSTIQSSARPRYMGPGYFQKIGENSGFASIVGCSDTKIDWTSPAHRCFACYNLPAYDEYVNSKRDWSRWYTSTLVFPLRYEKWGKQINRPHDYIMGFLTFDSLDNNIFGELPPIFDYIDKPGEYALELDKLEICHTGGIIADTLATVMMLERKLQKRQKIGVKE